MGKVGLYTKKRASTLSRAYEKGKKKFKLGRVVIVSARESSKKKEKSHGLPIQKIIKRGTIFYSIPYWGGGGPGLKVGGQGGASLT